jgi:hypothetical protein
MERARATAGTSIASCRVVNGDINNGWKFWVGKMLTAAVTVRGSAALISEVKENTSNNPIMKLCALFCLVANYATVWNAVHRVAASVQKS